MQQVASNGGNAEPTQKTPLRQRLAVRLAAEGRMPVPKCMTSDDQKPFLFLSDSDREAATSRLAVAGVPYVKKKLESSRTNWLKIIEIIKTEDFAAVLIKLTNRTLERMVDQELDHVAEELLERVSRLPHVAFVHATFFDLPAPEPESDEEADEWFGPTGYFPPLEDGDRREAMKMLARHDINCMPYRRNVELSVLASQFVDEHRENLVFRFYVPSGRLWAERAHDLLALFSEYLQKSLRLSVRLATYATLAGTTYEFFGDGGMSPEDVVDRLPVFAETMGLCMRDPERAERLLVAQGADADAVGRLVTDYRRKMRRIASDARHERERKVLDLRHQLEDELMDVAGEAELAAIRAMVDEALPASDDPAQLLGIATDRLGSAAPRMTTVNFQPQFIQTVNGIVAREINGTQNMSLEPTAILELIERHGRYDAPQLRSALHELEDMSAPTPARLSAGRRVQAFLAKLGAKAADKAADAGLAALQGYVQSKLGIG